MSTTTMNLQVPAQRTAPRGAFWLAGAAAAVWNAVTAPRAVVTDAPRDVRRARALAAAWQRQDPRSAADLTAAIDRYEARNGL